jgi:hypothetical protein
LIGRLKAEEEEHLRIKAEEGIARLKAEGKKLMRIQTERKAVLLYLLDVIPVF